MYRLLILKHERSTQCYRTTCTLNACVVTHSPVRYILSRFNIFHKLCPLRFRGIYSQNIRTLDIINIRNMWWKICEKHAGVRVICFFLWQFSIQIKYMYIIFMIKLFRIFASGVIWSVHFYIAVFFFKYNVG